MKTDETKGKYKTNGGIIRVRKDERYFTASNEPFVDKRLSWETRGLIGYLLTKPNNWQVRISDLEQQSTAGNYKIRRMLAEAKLCGYMNRTRVSKADGTFDWITEVFESPSLNPTIPRLSTSGLSTSGKPRDIVITESPSTELIERDSAFAEVVNTLETLVGGMKGDDARLIGIWLEKHTVERVKQAIETARAKGARSAKYVDEVLVSWEANGYPKSREERIADKKREPQKPNRPQTDSSEWRTLNQ